MKTGGQLMTGDQIDDLSTLMTGDQMKLKKARSQERTQAHICLRSNIHDDDL